MLDSILIFSWPLCWDFFNFGLEASLITLKCYGCVLQVFAWFWQLLLDMASRRLGRGGFFKVRIVGLCSLNFDFLTFDFGLGLWIFVCWFWTLNFEHWTLNFGFWTLDSGGWTLNFGLWTLELWCGTLLCPGGDEPWGNAPRVVRHEDKWVWGCCTVSALEFLYWSSGTRENVWLAFHSCLPVGDWLKYDWFVAIFCWI